MKEDTVHSLVVARTLLEQAETLCGSEDRYLASAGLLTLQDALEQVFYAMLLERDVHETKDLSRKSFDELIGELVAAGVPVPKSGTLKALNKQRVLTKHYAQLAEPRTVKSYFETAQTAIDAIANCVIGRSLRELFIADLLAPSEARSFLEKAELCISSGRYLEALTETRKAVFVEFETQYCIHRWRDYEGQLEGDLAAVFRGGLRAPYYMRSKSWIEKHVKVPTDYIQVDLENWRLQAMELGIHTVELQNIRKLTPEVFRAESRAPWAVTYAAGFPANNANEKNARYCLDRAVSIILKKQLHRAARREPETAKPFEPHRIYLDRAVHERPDAASPVIHRISEDFVYTVRRVVGGFNPVEGFLEVFAGSEEQEEDEEERKDAVGMRYGPSSPRPKYVYLGYLQLLDGDSETGIQAGGLGDAPSRS